MRLISLGWDAAGPQTWTLQYLSSLLLMQVEAMKSRKAAKAMTDYLRKINPELAAAMTDERDEVYT